MVETEEMTDGGNGGDEGEGGGEGNDPNEFEGCIVPPGRDPSDAGCPDTCASAVFFIADKHVMKIQKIDLLINSRRQ